MKFTKCGLMHQIENEVDHILKLLSGSSEQGFAALKKLDLQSVSDNDFQRILPWLDIDPMDIIRFLEEQDDEP